MPTCNVSKPNFSQKPPANHHQEIHQDMYIQPIVIMDTNDWHHKLNTYPDTSFATTQSDSVCMLMFLNSTSSLKAL